MKFRLLVIVLLGVIGVGAAVYVLQQDQKALEEFRAQKDVSDAQQAQNLLTQPMSAEGSVERGLRDLRRDIEKDFEKQQALVDAADPESLTEEQKQRLAESANLARTATIRKYTRIQLKGMLQLLRKMLNNPSSGGIFNPAQASSEKPALLSWRVHFLPLLGYSELYKKFHFNEPWDSEHNMALLSEMPMPYRHFDDDESATSTRFLAINGEQTLGIHGRLRMMADISDPESDTIALVVAGPELAVPWTKPDDLNLSADGFADLMDKFAAVTFQIGTVEGAALDIHTKGTFATLQSLATINGGEAGALDAVFQEKAAAMKNE